MFFTQHMGLYVLRLPIFLMKIVRIRVVYLIITISSEVWPICHCLALGHETMIRAVCLSIFSPVNMWCLNSFLHPPPPPPPLYVTTWQWTKSLFDRVIACRLLGNMSPLPLLTFCHVCHQGRTSVALITKWSFKVKLFVKPICSGLDVLSSVQPHCMKNLVI